MKTIKTLLMLLLLGTVSAAAQKEIQVMEPDGFTTESPIDVTRENSYVQMNYGVEGMIGHYITSMVFKGYNPGKELTRHLKVTLKFNSGTIYTVYDGDYTIPSGGTAEECIPLLELNFAKPVRANNYNFTLIIESSGEAASEPVYFESKSLTAVDKPVVTVRITQEPANFDGTVKGQDGKPVAGAQVCVYKYNYEKEAVDCEYTGKADADGKFSVMVADASITYQLAVTADGYADYVVDVPFYVGGTASNILPAPSGSVVLYNRVDFTAGQQASIILPEAPDPSWGRYYRLARQEGNSIIFEREYMPQANVPYVIFPERDFSLNVGDYDLKNLPEPGYVPFATVTDERLWGLHGSYQNINIHPCSVGSQLMLDSTPDCVSGMGGSQPRIGVFRAYLQAKWDSSIEYANPLLMFAGEPTAIEAIETTTQQTQATYDLQGRRIDGQPRQGIYIRDGRKVVVK